MNSTVKEKLLLSANGPERVICTKENKTRSLQNTQYLMYNKLTALPVKAARCKGVSPIPFLALTSAPF